MLQIPTFNQITHVMFYDTLQQLIHLKHIQKYNRQQISENQLEAKVLRQFGLKSPDDLELITNFYSKDRESFEGLIKNIARLSPKITLMIKLQRGFIRVNGQYAIYVDTSSNIGLSMKQRQLMSTEQLQRVSTSDGQREDDVHVFTTKHYYYGRLIQKLWRRIKEERMRR